MTPEQFIAKWTGSTLSERSGSQQHFLDLCGVLGVDTPADADPHGNWYAFDKGATKTDGSDGWADVWKRGHFAWEYKGKHKDLGAALRQVQQYALALESPPLLVTCDFDSIVVTTQFTNTVTERHTIPLADLGDARNLDKLRWLFSDPERLRPGVTRQEVTVKAAQAVAALAEVLRKRAPNGLGGVEIAHFLNKLLFCLFAQNVDLLPADMLRHMTRDFRRKQKPHLYGAALHQLFEQMVEGGVFGPYLIEHFNGGLFDHGPLVPLLAEDLDRLHAVMALDWSQIDPAIFGTLFERGLDPAKRSQLGAHYTDAASIQRIIDPVVVQPLRAEWQSVRAKIEAALQAAETAAPKTVRSKRLEAAELHRAFRERLAGVRVLDPACGSGNFLYVALRALKDLEHEVRTAALHLGLPSDTVAEASGVGPRNLLGIEMNPYAAELARLTVWIGEIQWMREHGRNIDARPVLAKLDTIRCGDALLDDDGKEARWPAAECIVGNPPFLGDKKMRGELGDAYVDKLRACYDGRVPGGADLVCHWFDKARAQLLAGCALRVGFVSTNSIRGGKNRAVLDRALTDGLVVYDARPDEDWWDTGVAVRVSYVALARPEHAGPVRLDGKPALAIRSDLSGDTATNFAGVQRLAQNQGVSFLGVMRNGPFDVSPEVARKWLLEANPHGQSNAKVLRPVFHGKDLVARPRGVWRIDFGTAMPVEEAALFESPFQHVLAEVKPVREKVRRQAVPEPWWILARTRPAFRAAVAGLDRFIATPTLAKHRLFVWLPTSALPDDQLVAIARADDTTFGILHSRAHQLWTLRLCTWLGVGNDPRYTPSTTFETFPFPDGLTPDRPAAEYAADPRAQAIATAARRLVELRDGWLNPPQWTERMPEVVAGYADRIVAKPGREADLKKRTLTNLYNLRPAWLDNAHRALDEAVLAAYGWAAGLADEDLLGRLVAVNAGRAAGGVAVGEVDADAADGLEVDETTATAEEG